MWTPEAFLSSFLKLDPYFYWAVGEIIGGRCDYRTFSLYLIMEVNGGYIFVFLTVKIIILKALVVNRGHWRTMQDNKEVCYQNRCVTRNSTGKTILFLNDKYVAHNFFNN